LKKNALGGGCFVGISSDFQCSERSGTSRISLLCTKGLESSLVWEELFLASSLVYGGSKFLLIIQKKKKLKSPPHLVPHTAKSSW